MSGTAGGDEPAAIRSEIERTREEMTDTIDEIQERLRPGHLLQQAKEGVTDAATEKARQIMQSAGETAHGVADSAQDAGRRTMSYAQSHPGQMALVAGGLTWWLLRRASRSSYDGWNSRRRVGSYGEDRYPSESGDYAEANYASQPPTGDGVRMRDARDTVGEYADSARDTARQMRERVRGLASGASSRTRQGWRRTTASVDDWVHEHPLAAGAVAVAVGAAIGISAPRSRLEDRTMGDTRDEALETAGRKAQELKENVQQKVQDVAGSVAGSILGGDSADRSDRGSRGHAPKPDGGSPEV
jgi:ElaB/YqjD/DUF883 family membrane-anchored ribosome-binding protein